MDDESPTGRGGPADLPGVRPVSQVSERMQALLSRAVEEQVSEQKAVSAVLADLRGQVAALGDTVRKGASEAAVARLGGSVDTVVADLRTATSVLGQRLDALAGRVDAVAVEVTGPSDTVVERLTVLTSEVTAHSEAVQALQGALAAFPTALAAVQTDVAGLHDRLQPLSEVRAAVDDLGARTSTSLEALRPRLEQLQRTVDEIGTGSDADVVRDAVVDALAARLDRLDEATTRPVVTPDTLGTAIAGLGVTLDPAPLAARLETLTGRLGDVEQGLDRIGRRLAEAGEAERTDPALAADVARVADGLEAMRPVGEDLAVLHRAVAALRDEASPALVLLGLAGLREDVDDLAARLAESAGPSADEVAAAVTQRLSDGLLDALAPRVAQVVLDRLGEDLVAQVADALATRLRADTAAVIQAANADSERRVVAHVDDSVLALAEALLRRRRAGRQPASPEPEAPVVRYPAEDDRYPEGVHQDGLHQEELHQQEVQLEEEIQLEEAQREEAQLEEGQREEVLPAPAAREPLVEPTADLDDGVDFAQDEEPLVDIASSDSGDAGEDLGGASAPLPPVPASPPLARPSVPTLTAASARWTMPTEQDTTARRRPWWRPGG